MDVETIDKLCARLSISRQALYSVITRNGIPKRGRGDSVANGYLSTQEKNDRRIVDLLLADVAKHRAMVEALEEENLSLRTSLAECLGSPPAPPKKPGPRNRS